MEGLEMAINKIIHILQLIYTKCFCAIKIFPSLNVYTARSSKHLTCNGDWR